MENHGFCLKFEMGVSVYQHLKKLYEIGENEIFVNITQKGRIASSHRLFTSIFLVVLFELTQSSK